MIFKVFSHEEGDNTKTITNSGRLKQNKEENQEICFECVNLEIFIRYISGIPWRKVDRSLEFKNIRDINNYRYMKNSIYILGILRT